MDKNETLVHLKKVVEQFEEIRHRVIKTLAKSLNYRQALSFAFLFDIRDIYGFRKEDKIKIVEALEQICQDHKDLQSCIKKQIIRCLKCNRVYILNSIGCPHCTTEDEFIDKNTEGEIE